MKSVPSIRQLPSALKEVFTGLSRFEHLKESDQASLLAMAMGMVKIESIIKEKLSGAKLDFDAWKDLPPEMKDLALATAYDSVLDAEDIVDAMKMSIEAQLVFRAEEKRDDFKEPFNPKDQQSRSVTIKGEGFSVEVKNKSTWIIQDDVSEKVKQQLSRYVIQVDDETRDECGVEAVNRMELAIFLKDIISGKLTEAKARKFIDFKLPESTPKEIINIQKTVRDSLLPSESKVGYTKKIDKKK